MCARWILLVYILKIHLKTITPQHHNHHYYEPALQQYDEDEDPDEYEEGHEYITRRKDKHHKVEVRLQESDECICSCDECNTKPNSCAEFCKYCHADATNPNQSQFHSQYQNQVQVQDHFPNQNQEQKVVFVPFPYPLIIPDAMKNNNAGNSKEQQQQHQSETVVTAKTLSEAPIVALISTEDPTTTTEATTTIKAPTTTINASKAMLRAKSMEVSMLSRQRHMKQLNPAAKRTRPAWVPKYGIVPIPDHLAAKLMTQLTEVRALKARRL